MKRANNKTEEQKQNEKSFHYVADNDESTVHVQTTGDEQRWTLQ